MGSTWELFVTFTVVLFTYIALRNLQARIKSRKWKKKYGCEDPPMFNHKDPLFGLDLYLENVRNVQTLNFLNGWKQRYQKYGHTFKGNFMGRPSIYTVNARNLQSVHALNFEQYGVQQIRRAPTLPFLGEGVFTMDGPFWKHSRALLRPTFTKDNVANLPAFEVHFQKFLKLLPADGSTVDLRPLLYRLFFDTSTEFLFGGSMDTLSTETTFRTQEFLDAFHYAQRGMGIR
ncbi:cytochrome P450, partial [Halenospora varia]